MLNQFGISNERVDIQEEDIAKIARVNPIVYMCLTKEKKGHFTHQQSLLWMIVLLADQNKQDQNTIISLFQLEPDLQQMAKHLMEEVGMLRSRLDEEFIDKQIKLK